MPTLIMSTKGLDRVAPSTRERKDLISTMNKKPVTTLIEDVANTEAPMLVTPTSSSTVAQSVTPETPEVEHREMPQFSQEELQLMLEEARRDARQAADALETLVEGVRVVKRILEKPGLQNSQNISKSHNCQKEMPGDLKLIPELSRKLHGVLGSDLLALVNAADMVREHGRLAAEEASVLVQDIHEAQSVAEKAQSRARIAEKVGRKLLKKNLTLKQDVTKLRGERRALVKEVKTLREEAEATRKFDTWRLLEQHVLESMAVHEMVLKTPKTPKANAFQEEFQTEDGESFVNLDMDKTDQQSPRIVGQSDMIIHMDKRTCSKSPTPSLEEVTFCTEDSCSDALTPAADNEQGEKRKLIMPKDVSFNTEKEGIDSEHASPLVSPNGSPPGVVTPDLKPICDPHILRTLAIPSTEKGNASEIHLPLPRACVGSGLYEC